MLRHVRCGGYCSTCSERLSRTSSRAFLTCSGVAARYDSSRRKVSSEMLTQTRRQVRGSLKLNRSLHIRRSVA